MQPRKDRSLTEIQRGFDEMLYFVDAYQGKGPLNCLIVGLGHERVYLDDPDIGRHLVGHGSYQPSIFAACCEGRGLDYNLTLLDKEYLPLYYARKMRKLVVLNVPALDPAMPMYAELTCRKLSYSFFKTDIKAKLPKSLRKKRKAGEITYIQHDISQSITFSNSPFDLIVCTNVLGYLHDPEKEKAALRTFRKNLSSKGVAIVSLHNIEVEDTGLADITEQILSKLRSSGKLHFGDAYHEYKLLTLRK
ncbi:MAG TPA: methyltransferase domain-containing protein [Candidatus Nanoarchaeia archaeon]|nr:methyltransferase domain-containing protein [Candidatus Nanoarchaeia archaeon]